jgi:hypothetical protein
MDVNTLASAWCRIVRHYEILREVVPARTRRSAILAALLSLAATLQLPQARAGNIVYAYDSLGRLIQASDVTGGQAVVYQYDSVGNISSQQIIPPGTLAVTGFPGQGWAVPIVRHRHTAAQWEHLHTDSEPDPAAHGCE